MKSLKRLNSCLWSIEVITSKALDSLRSFKIFFNLVIILSIWRYFHAFLLIVMIWSSRTDFPRFMLIFWASTLSIPASLCYACWALSQWCCCCCCCSDSIFGRILSRFLICRSASLLAIKCQSPVSQARAFLRMQLPLNSPPSLAWVRAFPRML